MTAAAFASAPASTSLVSVTQAMFHAEEKASNLVAIYVVGCGVCIAAACLALAYGNQIGDLLQLSTVSTWVVAALWMGIGGELIRRQFRHTSACTARYEAQVEQQFQAFQARKQSRPQAAMLATPRPVARLPISIFGAYL